MIIGIYIIIPIHAQTHYGIEIGGVLDDILASNAEAAPKFTYRIGAFINYDKYCGSGIYYVKKGANMSEFIPQYTDYIQKLDIDFHYIEIVPLSLRFQPLKINQNFEIVPIAGIYGSYGFSGKASLVGVDRDKHVFNKEINNVFKDHQFTENNETYNFKSFQPFDAGGRLGVDFIYDKFIFRLNWSSGLINISSYDKKIKNNSLDLSLCYLFK